MSRIRSASLNTERCLDIAAAVTSKRSVISPADILPDLSIFSISRRIGSASARIVFCKLISRPHLTFNLIVKCIIPHFSRFVNRKWGQNSSSPHFLFRYLSHSRQHSADAFHSSACAADHSFGLCGARIICRKRDAGRTKRCADTRRGQKSLCSFVHLHFLRDSSVNPIFPTAKDFIHDL